MLDPTSRTGLEPLNFNTKTQTGFVYELGFKYYFYENSGLFLRYLYTGFNGLEISGEDDIFSISNSDLGIKTQSFLLGFYLNI